VPENLEVERRGRVCPGSFVGAFTYMSCGPKVPARALEPNAGRSAARLMKGMGGRRPRPPRLREERTCAATPRLLAMRQGSLRNRVCWSIADQDDNGATAGQHVEMSWYCHSWRCLLLTACGVAARQMYSAKAARGHQRPRDDRPRRSTSPLRCPSITTRWPHFRSLDGGLWGQQRESDCQGPAQGAECANGDRETSNRTAPLGRSHRHTWSISRPHARSTACR